MPPAPVRGLVVCWIFFEISPLQCMLVRSCLDAVWTSHAFQFSVIWGADVVSFGVENVRFGMLVASTSAPWATIERSWRTSAAQERRLWDPGLDFYRFWVDFETAFSKLLPTFETENVFFVMRDYLMISGSASGCLGLQEQTFSVRGVAKTKFSHMLGLCSYGWFGTNFDDFWCFGDRL